MDMLPKKHFPCCTYIKIGWKLSSSSEKKFINPFGYSMSILKTFKTQNLNIKPGRGDIHFKKRRTQDCTPKSAIVSSETQKSLAWVFFQLYGFFFTFSILQGFREFFGVKTTSSTTPVDLELITM